jgi:23S rRNA G2445 N2-methylase RlmL
MPPQPDSERRGKKPGKELYRQLRALSCAELWNTEVPRFNAASPRERIERVSVIRAVSVVFSETGTPAQREEALQWIRSLVNDPEEKVRRYAVEALPKLGADAAEEAQLLARLQTDTTERERKSLGRALGRIGGTATLETLQQGTATLDAEAAQRVKARLLREQSPGSIVMNRVLDDTRGLEIHLRGRRGLEPIVADELDAATLTGAPFQGVSVHTGLVVARARGKFSLADLYRLRCFDTAGFVLGTVPNLGGSATPDRIADCIASPRAQALFRAFQDGPVRYRLEFADQGHQRSAVRQIADRVHALRPELLNDPSMAPWTVAIHPSDRGLTVELVPKMVPDPRLFYRQGDIRAASHPPLAACMARLAGPMPGEVAWDPFCGSGLELIERGLLGGVKSLIGSDLDPDALAVSRKNFESAGLTGVNAHFVRGDFHDFGRLPGLGSNAVSLILTNPPMGRRIAVPDLHGLISDLLTVAATVLRPGGRLVFPNPVRIQTPPAALELKSRQTVDLGGFDCRLEVYQKRS